MRPGPRPRRRVRGRPDDDAEADPDADADPAAVVAPVRVLAPAAATPAGRPRWRPRGGAGAAARERPRDRGPAGGPADPSRSCSTSATTCWSCGGRCWRRSSTTLDPASAVVALTATPPMDLGPREAALHDALFGTRRRLRGGRARRRQGRLPRAVPGAGAADRAARRTRRASSRSRVSGSRRSCGRSRARTWRSLPFRAWLDRRVLRRRSADGAPVGWPTFEQADAGPRPRRAALVSRQGSAASVRGPVSRRRTGVAPDAADWAALLGALGDRGARAVGRPARPGGVGAPARGLPAVGYRLTARGRGAQGVRGGPGPGALGEQGAGARRTILSAEAAALGERLRGLVLCDHESAGRDPGARLRGVLDPAAGSAALVLRTLLDGTAVRGLDPVMVTGRTVACSRGTAERLVRFAAGSCGEDGPGAGPRHGRRRWVGDRADSLRWRRPRSPHGMRSARIVAAPRWRRAGRPGAAGMTSCSSTRPTRAGRHAPGCRCSPGSSRQAAPAASSARARCSGRAGTRRRSTWSSTSRRPPRARPSTRCVAAGCAWTRADPRKVADLWDVVCVADGHPQGAADHARFARKHAHDLALNATGEIEIGGRRTSTPR